MCRRYPAALLIAFLVATLAACNLPAGSAGPAVWMDQPLDGSQLPLGPITLQAHASDQDGTASIEFSVDDESLAELPAGGDRLGEAALEWNPPGPGTYAISVRASDNRGDFGSTTTIQVTVGEAPAGSPTPPVGGVTVTPTDVTPTPTTTSPPSATPSGAALLVTKNANCRRGPGTAFEVVRAIAAGASLTIEGSDSGKSWFWVKPEGGSASCWISASVGTASGNLQAVRVIATPTFPASATPTPSDLTPPSFEQVLTDPSIVQAAGCGGTETFLLQAWVSDASGIDSVDYQIIGPMSGEGADGSLQPTGGDSYQRIIGPLAGTAGEWSIVVRAEDEAGNMAQAGPYSIQLTCIQ